MIRNLTRVAFATLAISFGLAAAGQAQILVGVNFQGRDAGSSNTNFSLAPTDTAGVIPQTNFNNLVFSPSGGPSTGGPFTLTSSTGTPTPITLTAEANDSWNSDGGTGSPNSTLMKGIVKAQNNSTATFTFMGLDDTFTYSLVAYTIENNGGDNQPARLNSSVGGQSLFTAESTNFDTDGGFIRASNSSALGTRDVGNYVQYDNLVSTSGTLVFTATHAGGTDGAGIAGFQLRGVPEPTTLTLGALSGLGMLGLLRRRKA